MEVWTFIHKETNEIIRCNYKSGDDDFGIEYFFTTCEYWPLWFVKTQDEAEAAYVEDVHPQYSMNYKNPSTDSINLEDYKIVKFELSNK